MASKGVLHTKHILELPENDSDSYDFEDKFSDSDYKKLLKKQNTTLDSEQEASDDNSESDNNEKIPLQRILLAKLKLCGKKLLFV